MGFKLIYTKNKKKIRREDLKRLKPIDRIDFLLQKKEIEEHYKYKPESINLIGSFLYNALLFLLLYIAAFGISSLIRIQPYMWIFSIIIKCLILFFFIELAFMIIRSLKREKEFKLLLKEKFK
jgi:sterol desaturase/sphingolipid hydroxylase (fatty acid hydroxylase superfamily)